MAVRLASALQAHSGGAPNLQLEVAPPVTVASVLAALSDAHPAVGRRLLDETGGLRRHVNVFVGPENIRDLDDLGTPVPQGAEVAVLPAISGG